jgi:hypothetical protein
VTASVLLADADVLQVIGWAAGHTSRWSTRRTIISVPAGVITGLLAGCTGPNQNRGGSHNVAKGLGQRNGCHLVTRSPDQQLRLRRADMHSPSMHITRVHPSSPSRACSLLTRRTRMRTRTHRPSCTAGDICQLIINWPRLAAVVSLYD